MYRAASLIPAANQKKADTHVSPVCRLTLLGATTIGAIPNFYPLHPLFFSANHINHDTQVDVVCAVFLSR